MNLNSKIRLNPYAGFMQGGVPTQAQPQAPVAQPMPASYTHGAYAVPQLPAQPGYMQPTGFSVPAQQPPAMPGFTFGQPVPGGPYQAYGPGPAPTQFVPQAPAAQPYPQPMAQPFQPYQPQQGPTYVPPSAQGFEIPQPGQQAPAYPQTQPQPPAPAPAAAPAPSPVANLPFTFGLGVDPAMAAVQAQVLAEQQEAQQLVELAKKDPQAALRQQAEKYQKQVGTYREAVSNHIRDQAVQGALFGTRFVSEHAAHQTLAAIAPRFESRLGADGNFTVVDKATGQPASVVVKQILAGPEFAHCLLPSTQGGGPPSQGWSAPANTTFPGQQPEAQFTEAEKNWQAWYQRVQQAYPGRVQIPAGVAPQAPAQNGYAYPGRN